MTALAYHFKTPSKSPKMPPRNDLTTIDDKQVKIRTLAQNRALHKWCTECAVELSNSGITVQAFVKDLEADFTMETVKMMWRAFAKAKYGKESTTELTSKQINEVYDECNRHLAQFGIHLPFPSQEQTDEYIKSLTICQATIRKK